MEDAFSRMRMIYGPEAMEKLQNSRVAVFGLGGVGGYVAESLARSGIGALDLVDNDRICLSNLNRQILATHATLGRYKTDVAAERIGEIAPQCRVTAHTCFYLPETRRQFDFGAYDFVVDAIDTVTAKIDLVLACREAGTPLISAMGTGNKTDPTALRLGDLYETSVCPLARVMRKELRRRGVERLRVLYSTEEPVRPACPPEERESASRRSVPGSTAFVPPAAGLIIASAVVNELTGFARSEG